MTPVKAKRKHQEPKMNVAGPESSCPDPAILTLAAKPNTGPHAGGYAKFNQTITVKRSKPKSDSKQQLFEVCAHVLSCCLITVHLRSLDWIVAPPYLALLLTLRSQVLSLM
jgi:hypothetical protein